MTGISETPYILHICTFDDWQAPQKGGYRPASFDEIGFIHCSTPQQLLKVANSYYPAMPDLLVLWIDPAKLNVPLKWEVVEGNNFPHIYGPLNPQAVVAFYNFTPDSDGIFREIPGILKFG
jgi:uncharacterized protein (DUF952 family)